MSSGKLCYERKRRDHLACFVADCYDRHDREVRIVWYGVLQAEGVEIRTRHGCRIIWRQRTFGYVLITSVNYKETNFMDVGLLHERQVFRMSVFSVHSIVY